MRQKGPVISPASIPGIPVLVSACVWGRFPEPQVNRAEHTQASLAAARGNSGVNGSYCRPGLGQPAQAGDRDLRRRIGHPHQHRGIPRRQSARRDEEVSDA